MSRLRFIIVLAALAAFALPATATAAPIVPIKVGQVNKRVCGLQWMLQGHKPSVYRGIKTYPQKVKVEGRKRCGYGKKTRYAVHRAKFWLGFPRKAMTGKIAGPDFLRMLKGKRARPLGYVARAADRRAATLKRKAASPSSRAAKMLALARSQIGVSETWGENWGPAVAMYQRVTGTQHLPWCAAFLQWLRVKNNLGVVGYPAPAHVFTVVGWARNRGLLRAIPKPGMWVAFMDRLGHIGIVERVFPGGFTSVEGNASDAVRRRDHSLQRNVVFIDQLQVAR